MYGQSGNWSSYFPCLIVASLVNSHVRFCRLQIISLLLIHPIFFLISHLSLVVWISFSAFCIHSAPAGSFQKMVKSPCFVVNNCLFTESWHFPWVFMGRNKMNQILLGIEQEGTDTLGLPFLCLHTTAGLCLDKSGVLGDAAFPAFATPGVN